MHESTARRPRNSTLRGVRRPEGFIVEVQPVLCVSCGRHDGYVPTELPPGVIYLCDECELKFGVPPEMLTPRTDLDQQRRS
jgi:hypothetical protein